VKSFCVFSLDDQHVWVASRIGAAMLLPAALPHQLRINPALMWQFFFFDHWSKFETKKSHFS
jgi:hypothetical protein